MVDKAVSVAGCSIGRLAKLGFKKAAEKAEQNKVKARKMALAYEHYRFVRQEKVDAFNARLREETRRKAAPGSFDYQIEQLMFVDSEQSERIPPPEVLDALEEALGRKCFDRFEIASIETVKEDPILFGRIDGCPDRFFIAQWDDDVKITDLIKENEG